MAGDNAAINPGACCGPRIITAAHRESAPSKRLRGFFFSLQIAAVHTSVSIRRPHTRSDAAPRVGPSQHNTSPLNHLIASLRFHFQDLSFSSFEPRKPLVDLIAQTERKSVHMGVFYSCLRSWQYAPFHPGRQAICPSGLQV